MTTTHTSTTTRGTIGRSPRGRVRSLAGRALVATALVAGLTGPTAAALADTPPAVPGIDIAGAPDPSIPPRPTVPPGPGDETTPLPDDDPACNPLLASCDLTTPDPDPDCNPLLASCDEGDRPGRDEPGDDVPGDDDPGDATPGAEVEVDAPVVAQPDFTG